MNNDHPIRPDTTFFAQRLFLLVFFNMLPLWFVFTGEWQPFHVIAYYWVEVVAAGVFAWLRMTVTALGSFVEGKIFHGIGRLAGSLFMTVHFGFFIVLTCFLVGSFLPEDTPKRMLTHPFVPLEMVVQNISFLSVFPFLLLWEAVYFMRETYHARQDASYKLRDPVLGAYGRLMILFVSGFFGLILAMKVFEDRLAGAVVLVALKTLFALAPLYIEKLKEKGIFIDKSGT